MTFDEWFAVMPHPAMSPEEIAEMRRSYEFAWNAAMANVALPEESGTSWVPVSERMPERYEPVLVAVRDAHVGFTHESFVPKGLLAWDGQRWCLGVSDTAYSGEVTHWMRLPTGPCSTPPQREEVK